MRVCVVGGHGKRWQRRVGGLVLVAVVALSAVPLHALVVTDVAGRGCGDGGPALSAAVFPRGITVTPSGLLIADTQCVSVRKLLSDGSIVRVAGSGVRGTRGGAATAARLWTPNDVTEGADGLVYWVEGARHSVHRVGAGGIVEDVVNLMGFAQPTGLTADGSALYVADPASSRVWKIATPCNAPCAAVPFAGDGSAIFKGDGGPALAAGLQNPNDVFAQGGSVYIADTTNQRIRRVNSAGIITTVVGSGLFGFAGDGGPATAARMSNPSAVTMSPAGVMYIADGNRIRRVGTNGIITTILGTGAVQSVQNVITPADIAFAPLALPLSRPGAVAVDAAGRVFVGSDTDGVLVVVTDTLPPPPTAIPSPGLPRCDVTADGTVSTLDAVWILQYIAGLNPGACQ